MRWFPCSEDWVGWGNEVRLSSLLSRSSPFCHEGLTLRGILRNSPKPWQRRINPYPAVSFNRPEVSNQAPTPSDFPLINGCAWSGKTPWIWYALPPIRKRSSSSPTVSAMPPTTSTRGVRHLQSDVDQRVKLTKEFLRGCLEHFESRGNQV